MRKLTHKRAVEKAYRGLMTQGYRCVKIPYKECVYRRGHAHCAIGWIMVGLVPPNDPDWDYYGGVNNMMGKKIFTHLNASFLLELQIEGHDSLHNGINQEYDKTLFRTEVENVLGPNSPLYQKAIRLDKSLS